MLNATELRAKAKSPRNKADRQIEMSAANAYRALAPDIRHHGRLAGDECRWSESDPFRNLSACGSRAFCVAKAELDASTPDSTLTRLVPGRAANSCGTPDGPVSPAKRLTTALFQAHALTGWKRANELTRGSPGCGRAADPAQRPSRREMSPVLSRGAARVNVAGARARRSAVG
jgi:hypothetical protein